MTRLFINIPDKNAQKYKKKFQKVGQSGAKWRKNTIKIQEKL